MTMRLHSKLPAKSFTALLVLLSLCIVCVFARRF